MDHLSILNTYRSEGRNRQQYNNSRREFNTPLSIMGRSSRQKINKEMLDLKHFRPSGTKKLIDSMSSNSNKIHILLKHTRNILKDVYMVGEGCYACVETRDIWELFFLSFWKSDDMSIKTFCYSSAGP